MQGIASSGYVVYVTAIFPYIVLTIFFFRGITLKGALAGLHHMFSPKVHCKKSSSVEHRTGGKRGILKKGEGKKGEERLNEDFRTETEQDSKN